MFSWDRPADKTKRFSGNRYSKQGIEYAVGQERQRERDVEDMNSYVAQSTMSNQEAEQMKRAEGARRRTVSLKRAGEAQLEQKYEAMEAKESNSAAREKDMALARQLAELAREEEKREREIQAICAQDAGLRELNEKIKAAYINRDRELQIQQSKQQSLRIKEEQAQLEVQMEEQRRKGELVVEEREEKRRIMSQRQRDEIQHQLRERQAAEQLQAILQYQKEKEQVDELIQSVYRQQQKEQEEIERQSQIMKVNMEQGLEIQNRRKEEQRQRELEEERRIAECVTAPDPSNVLMTMRTRLICWACLLA
jgi:hypothetical protein